jgi:predicted transcriptional regulator of viral defense system
MAVDADRRLMRLAARDQHGVFTIDQARWAGLSPAQIKHRLASGAWVGIFTSCYRAAGAPLTWRGQLLAACWATANGAVASHRSAAAVWELPGGRETPAEITCPRWLRGRHPGVIVHETKAMYRGDLAIRDGIPVTSVERTLLDLAAVSGDATIEMALDAAARRDLTTFECVRATVVRLSRPGRRGLRRLRRVLDLRSPEAALTDSEAETLLVRALRRHGLPPPVLQHVVCDGPAFVARSEHRQRGTVAPVTCHRSPR